MVQGGIAMFKNLKLAFSAFKKNWKDYLALSFVFGMIIFLGILLGQLVIGLLIAFIAIMIPAIISLKFCAFQSFDKQQVEYKSFKIGFITFFKSIKVYSLVILKPILIGLLFVVITLYFFMVPAINIASETIPNVIEALANSETFMYTYEEMLKIEEVKKLIDIGTIVSLVIGLLVAFSIKLKRDFIPFVAFEMPITSKRAIAMNKKILKRKYFGFFLGGLMIILMLLVPGAITYLVHRVMSSNEIYSSFTITTICSAIMCTLSSPIIMLLQLYYIYSYKELSKPFKEDFDNELKNVIKEIEELQKIINKNDEK